MSYTAASLLVDLETRGYREPQYEDLGYILTHDCCGKEFYFTDYAPPVEVDRETFDHALTCTASVPVRRVG